MSAKRLPWTPDIDQKILDMHASGATTTEICKALGGLFLARNRAVIMRLHKLRSERTCSERGAGPPKRILVALDSFGMPRCVGQLADDAPDNPLRNRGVRIYELKG